MRIPRQRIKIALRLWVPVLMLRIVAAQQEDNVIFWKYALDWVSRIQRDINPYAIVILSNTSALVRRKNETVTIDTNRCITKESTLQRGKMTFRTDHLQSKLAMGWGPKSIGLQSAKTGILKGVFTTRGPESV